MTKPSEPLANNRDRVILFGMGAVALLLTLLAINSTRSALDQVPSLQYQRHTDSIEEGLRQASTSRSQAAKRARWLAICGHEFEQALLKSDLSDVPSKQASGMLDVLKNEGADLASVYTLGFRLLAMERAGATAEEKYRTLGPQIRALQKLTFSHGQQELYEFWKQVFLSAGLDDQVASMESLAQIRFPHNAWLVFMDRQLAGMAAALNAEDAEAVKKLHLNLLIMMLIEPAPVGLHGMRERSGRIGLEAGRHEITVTFFERGGADNLIVSYAGPSFAKTAVTPAVLFRLDPDGNGEPGDPGEPGGPGDPGANQAPIAQSDSAATGIGAGQTVAVDVLANDSDPDGDILLLTGIQAGGAAGSAYVDQASGELRYVAPLGFIGVDRVGYVVSDRRGGTATAEVVISVGQDGAAAVMSAEDAVRLLTQATFGPTEAEIVRAMEIGAEAWIDEQLALPASEHAPLVIEAGSANRELRVRAWIEHALAAPDQLRQRLAFALSEILVVSDLGNDLATDDGALGATEYYDIMVRNAFGSYRQLLEEVTLHPAMGLYLNMAGNRKTDPILGTVPDENYAREILQLFSVGLWRLNPDGTRVLDAGGEPVASYTEDDVMEFARVFTGWDFAAESGP